MMKGKLTLSVTESTIKKAKAYARHTGRSLSELIENYLETLTDANIETTELSPKLKKIAGIVKLPSAFNEHAELLAYLSNKHL